MGKLTVRGIEAAKAKEAPYKMMDGAGLQLRVATDSAKTWLVRYMIGGKERQYRLPEPYGDGPGRIDLKTARDRAAEIRALARSGVDYQQKLEDERAADEARRRQEHKAKEAAERRLTVRALFDRWASLELAQRKDGGSETRRGLEKDVLPAIGSRYAEEVKRADIMEILDAVKARGANRLANRLLSEMRQMFSFAAVREIVSIDPTYGVKKRDVGGKDTERERVLSEDEIRTLPAKLTEANLLTATQHAIWAMLATGCRIGELTGAKRSDIDIAASTWLLPDTKNGKPHTIYLSEFANGHLNALLDLSGKSEWLMPGTQTDGPVCSKSITKQIYDRQRGQEKTNGTKKTTSLLLPGGRWVPHDLRRTAATMMQRLGVSGDVIERCLNHTEENKIKRVYQRDVPVVEMREAWRLLGERLHLLTRRDAENILVLDSSPRDRNAA